jgi:hypothetical protein
MTVVQTALVFVRGEAIPLDKVIAGFANWELYRQNQNCDSYANIL